MTRFTFLLLLFNLSLLAQQNFVGKQYFTNQLNGEVQKTFITIPEVNYSSAVSFQQAGKQNLTEMLGSMVRWNFTDAAAIGSRCAVSGNGQYSAIGWDLNNQRIS